MHESHRYVLPCPWFSSAANSPGRLPWTSRASCTTHTSSPLLPLRKQGGGTRRAIEAGESCARQINAVMCTYNSISTSGGKRAQTGRNLCKGDQHIPGAAMNIGRKIRRGEHGACWNEQPFLTADPSSSDTKTAEGENPLVSTPQNSGIQPRLHKKRQERGRTNQVDVSPRQTTKDENIARTCLWFASSHSSRFRSMSMYSFMALLERYSPSPMLSPSATMVDTPTIKTACVPRPPPFSARSGGGEEIRRELESTE